MDVTPDDFDTPEKTNRKQAAVVEDEEDYMPNGLTINQSKIVLCKRQKCEMNSVINHLHIKLRLKIPLCRLRALPLVRLINKVDVQQLENEFVTGYHDGDRVLYVSMYNDKAELLDVLSNIFDLWSGLMQSTKDRFEVELVVDPNLTKFVGKMLYVWESNHRLAAWWLHINNFHDNDKIWHMSVHCIVVDPRNETDVLLDAMNDINWYASYFCLVISLLS